MYKRQGPHRCGVQSFGTFWLTRLFFFPKGKRGPASSNRGLSPSPGEDSAYGLQIIRTAPEKAEFFGKTADILSAWRAGTFKAYQTYIKERTVFCAKRDEDPCRSSVDSLPCFLTLLYENGKSYSSVNLAKSAVATSFIGRVCRIPSISQ